ncbi:MAG: alginate export family protein [Methylotenera sp.]|nr:alginate export family protein [Methylotenera sp.]MDP2281242.1 alginate export family protein [Methylotenera sp.]MDP3061337.1 alginate export family protein [Methylotenera sp.]
MNRRLSISVFSALFMMWAAPLLAEDAVAAAPETLLDAIMHGKPMTNFRLRYESVDQEAFQPAPNASKKLDSAHAFTLRSLIGWQTAPYKNFSFAAQLTDVHEFNHNFNDRRENLSEPGKANYANIVDPSFTDVNQLFVDWTGIKNTKVRLGRQQVNLDNVRFIGDIGFRQNMQVFDGISVLNKSIPDTEIFAAHFDQVRQINTELRQGDIEIVNAKYRISPSESVTGYAYLVDVANLGQNNGNPLADSTAAQGGNGLGASHDLVKTATTDASSKTFGLRLDGVLAIDPTWKVLYTAEYAKQTDYKDGSELMTRITSNLAVARCTTSGQSESTMKNSPATMANMHSRRHWGPITCSRAGLTSFWRHHARVLKIPSSRLPAVLAKPSCRRNTMCSNQTKNTSRSMASLAINTVLSWI